MKFSNIKAKTIICPNCGKEEMSVVEVSCDTGKKQVVGFKCSCGLTKEIPDNYLDVCGIVNENQQKLI